MKFWKMLTRCDVFYKANEKLKQMKYKISSCLLALFLVRLHYIEEEFIMSSEEEEVVA